MKNSTLLLLLFCTITSNVFSQKGPRNFWGTSYKKTVYPKFDYNTDNFLKITNTNKHLNVVVLLVKKGAQPKKDTVIRIATIDSKGVYTMKNIPKNKYYLKTTWGKNWVQKSADRVTGYFENNKNYETSKEIDISNTENYYQLTEPSYNVNLD